MNNDIRVRFAPSPTGYLHIGGVRTALFNWLYAKKNNGVFVLRIEDTDSARSTDESKKVILDSLNWLGIDWSEGPDIGGKFGPYTQTERLDIYKYYADKLISEGKAYKCYCTKDDLDAARIAWKEKYGEKVGFKYPGTCRDKKNNPDAKDYVIRLKVPTDGAVEYTDKVFGKVYTPNKENQDFIIMRSDGIPLYNFGAVVDDMTMRISLVARGRDHMINTPPQILIYQALGVQHPEFAHLPMMLNKSGAKLSKRDGAVGVFEYRDAGYTPGAVLNYLARFGWAHGNQEVFSVDELIQSFTWEACGRNDGKFDEKKFAAIQFEHLKNSKYVSDTDYVSRLIGVLNHRNIKPNADLIKSALPLIRTRSHTVLEAADEIAPFISDDLTVKNDFTDVSDKVKKYIHSLLSELNNNASWEENNLRDLTKDWLVKNDLTLKELGGFMRLSLTGRPNSPEIFQVMSVLGKTKSMKRLQNAIENLK